MIRRLVEARCENATRRLFPCDARVEVSLEPSALPPDTTAEEVTEHARAYGIAPGWVVISGKHYCPRCAR